VAKHIKQEVTPRTGKAASSHVGKHMGQGAHAARVASVPAVESPTVPAVKARVVPAAQVRTAPAAAVEAPASGVISGPVATVAGVLIVIAVALAVALCLGVAFSGRAIVPTDPPSGFTVISGTLPA
jgi:hypothetical protein